MQNIFKDYYFWVQSNPGDAFGTIKRNYLKLLRCFHSDEFEKHGLNSLTDISAEITKKIVLSYTELERMESLVWQSLKNI